MTARRRFHTPTVQASSRNAGAPRSSTASVRGLRDFRDMADVVQLTVVATQGEADVICSLLRAYEIQCSDRATRVSVERGGGFGGWREILVNANDLETAREVIAAKPAAD